MKENKSYNDIRNTSEDWELDDRNNLPYSGKSVQTFIKKGIDKADLSYEERIGDTYFDPLTYTIYFFKSTAEKEQWLQDPSSVVPKQVELTFARIQKQLKIINEMESLNVYFTTVSETAELKFSFLSQEKELTSQEWRPITEDAFISVSVDKGGSGEFVEVLSKQLLLNGESASVDVKKYLTTGSNRVRVTVTGASSEAEDTIQYQVNLTSMYLTPSNFAWYVPFVEGKDYNLGGMNIGGAIDKKLFVKVTNGNGYYKLYEKNIGTATYITNAYFFNELEFPSAGTGVYNVELWLDANGLESDHLSYNIICVSQADETTAQLVSISSMAEKAVNYADNTLFQYSIYNGGAAKATPHIKITASINATPIVLKDEDLINVDTTTKLPYNFHLEIETNEGDLQLTSTLTFGNEQVRNFVIDNSASYPSTSGASFYLNAANRNNSQANKKNIINEITKGTVACDWENMAFDGIDGWTTDDEGRKCLLIPAGSRATIHYQPLSSVGTGKTIEFNFKVKNAANYSDPIITICDDPNDAKFKGIRILPKKVVLHSRDKNTADYVQGYDFMDEQYVNMLITIIRNYKTNYGNIATIYVNGSKKCSFEFTNADSFEIRDANIVLGNNTADLYLYTCRVYESGFGFADSQKNYICSLNTSKEKADAQSKMNNILDDSYNVDYDKVFGIYNTMVIEMLDGAELPHYGLSKEYSANCNLELNILNEDEDKPTISGIYKKTPVSGQGTTSMNYFRWNLRWKKLPIRLTAKKNYASSMQSHKMGACGAYNDLHDLIVGQNEAGARVAVYQYPAFGFLKTLIEGTTDRYTYEFIGMFTVGPDKGDKGTFGYNGEFKDTVISMEGKDHSIKGVGFDYPYEELLYEESKEALCVDRGSDDSEAAWEVSVCGNKKSESDIQVHLNEEFAPAYKCVYDNSVMIMGTSESISTINANVNAWGMRTDSSGRPYQHFEFWIDGEYDLYYLSRKTNTYVKNGTNLLTQLGLTASDVAGMTIEEKNELFIRKRVERFRSSAGDFFNIQDILFSFAFLMIYGVSDNFKKNSYPYKFRRLVDGGRWCYRQDDMDTLADIDNQNLSTKAFSIELPDFTDDTKTAYVYKGENSILLQNVLRAFPTEFKQMGKSILAGMYELSGKGTDTIERLTGFFDKYFWDKAQNYFPKSIYNIDAEYSYEEAWPPYKKGNYVVDVHPLEQSRGDHYEAERDWFINRMIYCASKFGYGPFAQYNDSSLGVISFRTQLAQDFTLTPAIDLYPTIHSGQSAVLSSSERVKAGESVSLNGAGGTNTNVYIKGADLLTDIGDLKTLSVDAANASISVASKRLQRLKIGDENAESVTSNLASVNMGECPSLMLIDARNLASLSGTFDLSQCPRIREAYFGGTDIRAVTLANGSKITHLQLSDVITQISMQNLKFLDGTGLETGDLSKVEFFRVENCEKLDAFGMLKELYNAEGSSLKNIRVIGFVYDGDATDVDMIGNLAKDIDANGANKEFTGIDSEGNPQATMIPVIEGTLNIAGSVFQDSAEFVTNKYPNLVLNVTGGYYIRFADNTVNAICATNWGDGIGVTEAQAAAVTTIGTKFKENKKITSFDELGKFTGVTSLDSSAFYKCSSLLSVDLSNIKTIKNYAFRDDTLFAGDGDGNLSIPKLEQIEDGAFCGYNTVVCTGLKRILDLGTITTLPDATNTYSGVFGRQSELEEVVLPETLTSIGNFAFNNCTKLSKINFPASLTKIGRSAFEGCSPLVIPDFSFPNLTTLDDKAFSGCTSIEIPDLSLPSLTSLGENAFNGAKITKISNLGEITTLPNVSTLSATYGDRSILEEVVLPNTVKTIGNYSFYEYPALRTVTIQSGAEGITLRAMAFYGCTSLETIPLSDVVTLTNGANFKNDRSLSIIVDMPRLTGVVPYGAFENTAITGIENLGEVTTIQGHNNIQAGGWGNHAAFRNCTGLTFVKLPATLREIQYGSFAGCTSLESITFDDASQITTIGVGAFYDVPWAGEVNFPNLEGTLGYASFQGTGITKITNLGKITTIGGTSDGIGPYGSHNAWGAFKNCASLTSVVFPDSLTTLGDAAFYGCTSLEIDDLILPNLTSIGKNVFYGVKIKRVSNLGNITSIPNHDASSQLLGNKSTLQEITLPSTLTSIGNNAFYGYSSVIIEDLSLPNLTSLGQSAFYGVKITKISNLGSITTLPTSNTNYPNYGDKSILEEVALPDTLTEIPDNSFNGYTKLSKVTFPSGLITMGDYSFKGCPLTEVTLPSTIKTISGFNNCKSLQTVNIQSGAEGITLGAYAFSECNSLDNFDFSPITSILYQAFYNAKLTGDITFPNVASIGAQAFRGNTMTKIHFPSVVELKPYSNYDGIFSGCNNLTLIDIGETCTTLGDTCMGRYFGVKEGTINFIFRGTTPPTLGGKLYGDFGSIGATTQVIYVPDESVDAYKQATNWSRYADKIKPLSEYVE